MSDHKVYNTPLLQKIGIQQKGKNLVLQAPDFLLSILVSENITFENKLNKGIKYACIWTFINSINELEEQFSVLPNYMESTGMLWISWYKKASKCPTELNENIIRDTALSVNLVDVKVASVNEQWSALKIVIPIAKR